MKVVGKYMEWLPSGSDYIRLPLNLKFLIIHQPAILFLPVAFCDLQASIKKYLTICKVVKHSHLYALFCRPHVNEM